MAADFLAAVRIALRMQPPRDVWEPFDYSGGGRIRVPVWRILASPKVQAQVAAVREMRECHAQGGRPMTDRETMLHAAELLEREAQAVRADLAKGGAPGGAEPSQER